MREELERKQQLHEREEIERNTSENTELMDKRRANFLSEIKDKRMEMRFREIYPRWQSRNQNNDQNYELC